MPRGRDVAWYASIHAVVSVRRPRWHDALIVLGIVALGTAGAWVLWGDEVRAALHLAPVDEPTPDPVPRTSGQT